MPSFLYVLLGAPFTDAGHSASMWLNTSGAHDIERHEAGWAEAPYSAKVERRLGVGVPLRGARRILLASQVGPEHEHHAVLAQRPQKTSGVLDHVEPYRPDCEKVLLRVGAMRYLEPLSDRLILPDPDAT